MASTPYVANLYIGGAEVQPSTGNYTERYDPGDSRHLIGKVADGSHDVGAAIDSAREAFDRNTGGWVTDYRLRARVLLKAAEILRARAEELAVIESLFVGKTIRTSRTGDLPRSADMFEFYAGIADKILGYSQILRNGDMVSIVKQPAGVVASIVPWNFPLLILARQTAPALAAGCTVVAKPATYTPVTALELAKILAQAGIPAGVFNVVTGGGEAVGSQMVRSEKADVVNFTGETTTGKWIMQTAAGTLKRVVLELGGKNPNIIFEDADLKTAANAAVYGAFANNGESCAAGSRLLVQRSIKEKFVEMLLERVARIKVGYQLREDSDMGPLVSQSQLDKVMEYGGIAASEGLKIAAGGKRLTGTEYSKGNYVQPTVIVDTPPDSRLFREEIFGPIVTVTEFETEREAVDLANSTIYGLASGVWSRDLSKAIRVGQKIQAGTVWLNTYYTLPVEQPWGGFKQSGIGRNNTVLAIEHYLESKGMYLNSSGEEMKPYYKIVLGH